MTLEELKIQALKRQVKKNVINNSDLMLLINKNVDEGKIEQQNIQNIIDDIQGTEIEIKE